MKKRKWMHILLSVVAALLLISGCGSSDKTKGELKAENLVGTWHSTRLMVNGATFYDEGLFQSADTLVFNSNGTMDCGWDAYPEREMSFHWSVNNQMLCLFNDSFRVEYVVTFLSKDKLKIGYRLANGDEIIEGFERLGAAQGSNIEEFSTSLPEADTITAEEVLTDGYWAFWYDTDDVYLLASDGSIQCFDYNRLRHNWELEDAKGTWNIKNDTLILDHPVYSAGYSYLKGSYEIISYGKNVVVLNMLPYVDEDGLPHSGEMLRYLLRCDEEMNLITSVETFFPSNLWTASYDD